MLHRNPCDGTLLLIVHYNGRSLVAGSSWWVNPSGWGSGPPTSPPLLNNCSGNERFDHNKRHMITIPMVNEIRLCLLFILYYILTVLLDFLFLFVL